MASGYQSSSALSGIKGTVFFSFLKSLAFACVFFFSFNVSNPDARSSLFKVTRRHSLDVTANESSIQHWWGLGWSSEPTTRGDSEASLAAFAWPRYAGLRTNTYDTALRTQLVGQLGVCV